MKVRVRPTFRGEIGPGGWCPSEVMRSTAGWLLVVATAAACAEAEVRDRRDPASATSAPTSPAPAGPVPSDGRPRDAVLSIAAIGIERLDVVAYEGKTDDGPGTVIQNRGVAASPYGPDGGVGPGGIGNYQVTAHRLSSTQAFLELPKLKDGDRVEVVAGERTYVYEIRQTRETSFRSEESLLAQRAAVPGRPGQEPTRAYITLSTCSTPEDHAAGNWWSDEFGNPEHRIDKIGVLVDAG